MKPSSISVRKATASDADAIWHIFHHVVKTGDTYAFSPTISKEEALGYWLGADKYTYVAEKEGTVVGTFIIRNNQATLGAHVANGSFMVAPEAHGKGVGKTMGEAALEEAKLLGYEAMQYNFVVSTNTPAVALWKKLGFEIIGTVPRGFRHQPLVSMLIPILCIKSYDYS